MLRARAGRSLTNCELFKPDGEQVQADAGEQDHHRGQRGSDKDVTDAHGLTCRGHDKQHTRHEAIAGSEPTGITKAVSRVENSIITAHEGRASLAQQRRLLFLASNRSFEIAGFISATPAKLR